MPLPYSGRKTGAGSGLESTYGVSVSRTAWVKAASVSFQEKSERPSTPHLVHQDVGTHTESYLSKVTAGGDLEAVATYDAPWFGNVLYAAMGAGASAGGPTYIHTLDPADTLPSFTWEVIRGNGSAEIFLGMKCSSLSLTQAPNDVLRCKTNWIGKQSGNRVSIPTPSYVVPAARILNHEMGALNWNSGTFARITSFEVTINNNLETRDVCGSQYTDEPDFAGFREVMIKMSLLWDQDTFETAMRAGTTSDATLSWTGTASPNALDLTLHNAHVSELSDPITGEGVVAQNVTLKGFGGPSDKGLQFVLTNTVAGTSYYF